MARALAGAFLAADDWQPAAMARLAKRVVADRRRWTRDVAEIVVRAFPDRPSDRPRALADLIAVTEPFRTAWDDRERPLRVHTWMAAPTSMGARRWPVPVIDDLSALAAWLGVTPAHLDWFADRRSLERAVPDERLRHHHRRWVRTRDGGVRLLEAPKRELKDLQRQVLHHILDRIPPHLAAHGFRSGRSPLTAARPHAGHALVLCFDLEGFFTSVRAGRVHGVFRLAGYPEPVAHTLAALCTTVTPRVVLREAPRVPEGAVERRRRLLSALAEPHLAQGAPTSPALANLVAHGLDRRLAGLAESLGATYTRYADDLVLSGDGRLRRLAAIERAVARIAGDEGFRLHSGKSRRRTAAQRQTVLGLVVNDGRGWPGARSTSCGRCSTTRPGRDPCVRTGPRTPTSAPTCSGGSRGWPRPTPPGESACTPPSRGSPGPDGRRRRVPEPLSRRAPPSTSCRGAACPPSAGAGGPCRWCSRRRGPRRAGRRR